MPLPLSPITFQSVRVPARCNFSLFQRIAPTWLLLETDWVSTIMTEAQRAIREEVYQHFNALPHDHMIMAERNREALETLGVW